MENIRKWAKSIKDIPGDIMEQLNIGQIETANLVEWLAIDQKLLLANVLYQLNRSGYLAPILLEIEKIKKQTVNTVQEAIGLWLLSMSATLGDNGLLEEISGHKSDVARCWAVYAIGRNRKLSIPQMFEYIKPFASDWHFGVREISWLAVRPRMAENLWESIVILSDWAISGDPNIRRFSSEATRPRGVWCSHIDELKKNPEKCLSILEPLKSDISRYVQDSVGNWLNDASKTQPLFVEGLCRRWREESDTKETIYITKKALRTIEK